MPLIYLSAPAGSFTDTARDGLEQDLTEIGMAAEQVPPSAPADTTSLSEMLRELRKFRASKLHHQSQEAPMTAILRDARQITYAGAAIVIQAALDKAHELQAPENISVVDAGGNLVAFARMDGARFLAQYSSISKAQSAVSLQMPTGQLPPQFGVDLALATGNRSINLPGGLPIEIGGVIVGGIGVSSGADADDVAVAEAGRAALMKALSDIA